MIKLESAHIEEVRGIRKLDINFGKSTFAVSGPNGSGKSGIIDAIEFGLTGEIGRLTGRGTKGLSLAEHGPHVDMTKFPDAAFVQLRVFLTKLGKSATITRKVSSPKKPKIEPPDEDVKSAVAEIADHPEITLSRREILRFILVEPTKRSEEIQTILKLDNIGHTRNALNTAQNRLQGMHKTVVAQVQTTRSALQQHLQIATMRSADVLEAVNKRRAILLLTEIAELTSDSRVDAGPEQGAQKALDFNKGSALRDIKAVADVIGSFSDLARADVGQLISILERLEAQPALLFALQVRAFLEKGLSLVNEPQCPLCDMPWEDERQLRAHLQKKIETSKEAKQLEEELLKLASRIAAEALRVSGLLAPLQKLADGQGNFTFSKITAVWKNDLDGVRAKLSNIQDIISLKARLINDWLGVPKDFLQAFGVLSTKIEALPDQSAAVDAQTFLAMAQSRLSDYREAMRKSKVGEMAAQSAKEAYDLYCTVLEDELNTLYEEVQKDFSIFYRIINDDDESTFIAKLTPTEGSLAFDVNFFDRGLFPPAAYHSEGHQDGMGVCLYLALMKRLYGDQFTFALLDDVVMSVDVGHRYQFCKLLKSQFPNTQFVITTHDRLWAEQMRSAGLVTAKTSLVLHGWTIGTGPLVESNLEIWDEIAAALAKGKVEVAAPALRRHLEFISRLLAGQLGASIQFRADGNYELGDLLPNVVSRLKDLYGKAANAAQSWGNDSDKQTATQRKDALSEATIASNVEQWAVNKAVHYNEWTNFGRKDFEPVVAAYKDLLECFRCEKCDSWIHIAPRIDPESIRCFCGATNANLKAKAKQKAVSG